MIYLRLAIGILLIIKALYSALGSNTEKKIETYRNKYGENGSKYYYFTNVILPIITGVIFMIPGLVIPAMY
ncbi:hypothetical protein [Treponema sp. C6A8]|uniref:hypothetical protein n=1 Tax=Treponema sp. C6A8 TaxID=1410609 RepID=UPI0004866D0B|nr:hypothetical protein [Treponema sp. C6A8]